MKRFFLPTALLCTLAMPIQSQLDPTQSKLVYKVAGMADARVEAGQTYSEWEARPLAKNRSASS